MMASKLKCILLIDDDKLTNLFNKALINAENAAERVIVKESAQSAITYLTRSCFSDEQLSCPEIIFLDINMPEVSGWDFMENYQELKFSLPFQPKIIMLTSMTGEKHALKLSDYPEITNLCFKPLTSELLHAMIAERKEGDLRN